MNIFILFRQAEIVAPVIDAAFSPITLVATFVAAALGSMFAPMIGHAVKMITDMELPVPEFPRIRRKDDKSRYQGKLFKKFLDKILS